jgi:hypothetical protein
MEGTLHHLAVVVDGVGPLPSAPGEVASLAARILALFGSLTADAFDLAPGLHSLSLFSPALRDILLSLPDGTDPPRFAEPLRQLEKGAASAGASLRFHGPLAGLPAPDPRTPPGPTVNIFVEYSGRGEIVRAARHLLRSGLKKGLDEDSLASHLMTAGQPDPDLIIYAGGDLEPKDFLLWQSSYAEIWHTAEGGLHFSRQGLLLALTDFRSRQRRFGAV